MHSYKCVFPISIPVPVLKMEAETAVYADSNTLLRTSVASHAVLVWLCMLACVPVKHFIFSVPFCIDGYMSRLS